MAAEPLKHCRRMPPRRALQQLKAVGRRAADHREAAAGTGLVAKVMLAWIGRRSRPQASSEKPHPTPHRNLRGWPVDRHHSLPRDRHPPQPLTKPEKPHRRLGGRPHRLPSVGISEHAREGPRRLRDHSLHHQGNWLIVKPPGKVGCSKETMAGQPPACPGSGHDQPERDRCRVRKPSSREPPPDHTKAQGHSPARDHDQGSGGQQTHPAGNPSRKGHSQRHRRQSAGKAAQLKAAKPG